MDYDKLESDLKGLNKHLFKIFCIIAGILLADGIAFYLTDGIVKAILLLVLVVLGIPLVGTGFCYLYNDSLRKTLIEKIKKGDYD